MKRYPLGTISVCEMPNAPVCTAFWISNTFVIWISYQQPSISTPFQPAQPAQLSGAFGFSNFGQTQPGQFIILSYVYTTVCLFNAMIGGLMFWM